MQDVVILAGARTAIGDFGKSLSRRKEPYGFGRRITIIALMGAPIEGRKAALVLPESGMGELATG